MWNRETKSPIGQTVEVWSELRLECAWLIQKTVNRPVPLESRVGGGETVKDRQGPNWGMSRMSMQQAEAQGWVLLGQGDAERFRTGG